MVEVAKLKPDDAGRLEGYASVLEVLIRFFDRELDGEYLAGFQRYDVATWVSGWLATTTARQGVAELGESILSISQTPSEAALDELAAEYADLMLTNGYRVSPSASVWLTEDHLERQMPMFDVRDWYDHYDISVPDWRLRADDHLVHLLQFVAFLCRAGTKASAEDAARFLDAHILSWVPEFCRLAQPRVRQPIYACAISITPAVLDELRDALEQMTGIERDLRLAAPPKASRTLEEDAPYMPGLAESW